MEDMKDAKQKERVPEMFRPLLWWSKWDRIDAWDHRRDIIMGALTNGRIEHVRWIIAAYGRNEIKRVLSACLETEFHAGARNLARVLFDVSKFRHAR
jgi:hypothetical protein